ncbi:phosphorylase b kinase gamma catalytic chain, skeletal muscle/heart isoform-like isoform X2 [Pollicipes pollicipes]|uniref:phosphorylase b kinase gamma catalytic chain, skeletal muscle/heart isoform-like isoform X1 n=1 Tax=Pollicipes pollicipes TaxID=41117 RepID=UPI0018854444|nr:phosphorylase b kinase gamma catalytic chain, skeletal muscle/heart isoform-like isoform X1 [Pollicipes pollicipes]XP_037091955.1 phosphorylase b kinase gamma catalytic chain, skeletal muscle/heart isoform-like isoform X1 [Pollicipes pollicipes]XP_037091956.1 phosphorylase b kinase gamma catalytic chain, skeletal muscle/heart isoform-like isoform X1 [Pollicipes pollicipes]XP_037092191.1 phosphorylase b kinase gamma catalytic chain, skeletal muscle/heart isoform-like isoform X2 [Pollicipes pol
MTVMDDSDDVLPDAQSAKVFYGKYEPKEVLGRGVSSTVRRCVDKESGVEYAVKIIDISEADHGSDIKESTHREIEVLRMVQGHPYVIELHDVFESETHIFLVFELLRQGELFDYLTTVVTLSEKKTKHIMKQLLEALLHVHDKSVVHRDVKPENILLDDNLDIKLTDFGFARILRPGEELYDLVGTPGYLAPELLRANMVETAPGYRFEVDTWACGVVMYTLLVGCPPFWHRKQMVMLRNIMEGKYTFGSPEWDDVTDAPKDLIGRLLTVDPARRITVREALAHPFFHRVTDFPSCVIVPPEAVKELPPRQARERPFSGRRTFRLAINCVRAAVRIQRLKFTPEALSVSVAVLDPYRLKSLRKIIDACAFRVYGHWVKKAEGQNRAMLFENIPRTDLRRTALVAAS